MYMCLLLKCAFNYLFVMLCKCKIQINFYGMISFFYTKSNLGEV